MSILDAIDDPNFYGSLFGPGSMMGGGQAPGFPSPQQPPPQPPPPNVMAGAGGGFSPTSAFDANMTGGGAVTPPLTPNPPPQNFPPIPEPPPISPQTVQGAQMQAPQGQFPGQAMPAPPNYAAPYDLPPNMPSQGPAMPRPGGPAAMPPLPQQPPMPGAQPMQPRPAPAAPPPMSLQPPQQPPASLAPPQKQTPFIQIRAPFSQELSDPRVRERFMRLTEAEVGGQGPRAAQAFMESVFNRAAARGQTLAQAMNDRAYYPHVSIQGREPSDRPMLENALYETVNGGNISNYATGNASGKVMFAGGPQTYAPGTGERFGVEGSDVGWARALGFTGGGLTGPPGSRAMMGPAGGLDQQLGLPPGRYGGGNALSPILASLGGGLAAMGTLHPGATGAQAFGVGAGGALLGGVGQQNRMDALTQRDLAARAMANYRARQLGIAQGTLDTRRADVASKEAYRRARAEHPAWNKPPSEVEHQYEQDADKKEKSLNKKHGVGNPGNTPEQEMEARRKADEAFKEWSEKTRKARGLDKKLDFDPLAQPITKEQLDQLPDGAEYWHPNMPKGPPWAIKGGVKKTPTAAPVAAAAPEEDEDEEEEA